MNLVATCKNQNYHWLSSIRDPIFSCACACIKTFHFFWISIACSRALYYLFQDSRNLENADHNLFLSVIELGFSPLPGVESLEPIRLSCFMHETSTFPCLWIVLSGTCIHAATVMLLACNSYASGMQ